MARIAAGQFKDQCLKVLDQVAERRTSVTITKRGKPIATLVPYKAPQKASDSLVGSILQESGDPFSTHEPWDADLS